MTLPQDGQNANDLTKVTQIPAGKELMFIDPTTNEGGIITLEDLTKQILNGLLSQTFALDAGQKTIIQALNTLNSESRIRLLRTTNENGFSETLKGNNYKMTVGYFSIPHDNPFSFVSGYYLAFQSDYLAESNAYTIVGIDTAGNIECKLMQLT